MVGMRSVRSHGQGARERGLVDIGFCVVIGRRLEVEIVQPDGARTRVVGTIDRIRLGWR